MSWEIDYPYQDVQLFVLKLSPGLSARYFRLTELMIEFGANLGMPHTRAMANGLFELRIQAREGIARVFYCTRVGKRIVMFLGFVKKSEKTPRHELRKAESRLKEIKRDET